MQLHQWDDCWPAVRTLKRQITSRKSGEHPLARLLVKGVSKLDGPTARLARQHTVCGRRRDDRCACCRTKRSGILQHCRYAKLDSLDKRHGGKKQLLMLGVLGVLGAAVGELPAPFSKSMPVHPQECYLHKRASRVRTCASIHMV